MKLWTEAKEAQAELFPYIEEQFGLKIHSATPIDRGWMNRKWQLETSRGVLFAKEYHPKRYKIGEEDNRLDEVRLGLSWHARLHKQGVPCPRLYEVDEEHVLCTENGHYFVLMEYCPGELMLPGQIHVAQMHDLGRVTGRMHRLMNDEQADADTVQVEDSQPTLSWTPSLTKLTETWQEYIQRAQTEQLSPQIQEAIALQRRVLDQVDFEQFADCEVGWTHADLWVDNLLFTPTQTAAVLDFDRLRFAYPELDVARAVLSGALHDGQLDVGKVVAYMDGYREERPFPPGGVIRALQLAWCYEAIYWVSPRLGQGGAVAARFAEEMIWLAEHFGELDDLLQHV